MTKRNGIILGAVIVAVIAVYAYRRHASASQETVRYVTSTAAKQTVIASVSGSGNVQAENTVKVSPSITGTVANLDVHLGDQVKAGQHLFDIVNASLDLAVSKSYASYLQAQQALSTAQGQLVTAQATYTNQSQDAGQAKAQASLDQAQGQLLTAQNTLSQDQQTLASTPSDAAAYATVQNKVAADQSSVTAAQDNLNAASIAQQQAKVSAAASVQAAAQQVKSAQSAIQIAQQNVENALADYDNQKATAASRTVTAPISGTITTLSIGNGDQLGSGGQASASAAAPLIITDLSTLKAGVEINEVDAPSIQPGQKATLTFDAIDGLTLTGKVEKIDAVGTVSQGVVTYAATIDFDAVDGRLRPGMSASASITTAVKQDVVAVPATAVKTDSSGASYVQLMVKGSPVQRTVVTGIASDTDTEITSGLSEGDTVVTQTITSAAASSAAKTTGLGGLGGGFGGGGATRALTGGARGN